MQVVAREGSGVRYPVMLHSNILIDKRKMKKKRKKKRTLCIVSREISGRTCVSENAVKSVLYAFSQYVREQLLEGNEVELLNVGVFTTNERVVTDNLFRDSSLVGHKIVLPRFRTSRELKFLIRDKFLGQIVDDSQS